MKTDTLVYPNETFDTCDDIVETIRTPKQYTEKALSYSLATLSIEISDTIRNTLQTKRYTFVPCINWCTPERLHELEENCSKQVYENPQIQQLATFQFGFCI